MAAGFGGMYQQENDSRDNRQVSELVYPWQFVCGNSGDMTSFADVFGRVSQFQPALVVEVRSVSW